MSENFVDLAEVLDLFWCIFDALQPLHIAANLFKLLLLIVDKIVAMVTSGGLELREKREKWIIM